MNPDEYDDLSALLARAKPRKPSPAFVQNVVRAVRMSEPEPEVSFVAWLRNGWNWLALAGAAAVLLFIAVGSQHPSQQASSLATRDAAVVEEALQGVDLTVVSNLNFLLALDDKNPWLESSQP